MNALKLLHQMQFPGNPTILAVCLALPCLTVSARAETYDARVDGTQILTPPAGPAPAINGPEVYGVRPGSPVIYRIPTTGSRPIRFTAKDLPATLRLDQAKGVVTGHAPASAGRHVVTLHAENDHGKNERKLTFVVGDKFALTPPMGWNHWYTHYHFITDAKIRAAAETMVASGMADVGYSYVSIDDCWMRLAPEYVQQSINKNQKTPSTGLDLDAVVGEVRDTGGRILPNKNFPDMPALTGFIHALGLKAGIYSSPGPRTCQQFEGSYGHEDIDVKTYADWGFDLLKYDWCKYGEVFNALPRDQQTHAARQKPYRLMAPILARQKRDIQLNLCQYGMAEVWKWGAEVGQSWRVGGDLGHTITKNGVYEIARKTINIREHNGPSSWNDPDYLILGKWVSPFDKASPPAPVKLTPNEQYSYMSLWCLMACPLFFSGDMGAIDDFTRGLLCNPELIAINQDVLGRCAAPVRMDDGVWILKKELADGSIAIGLFDIANQGDQEISVTLAELGINQPCRMRDLWRRKDAGTVGDKLTVRVGSRGCAVLRLVAAKTTKP
jgi:alpha-galactosidase